MSDPQRKHLVWWERAYPWILSIVLAGPLGWLADWDLSNYYDVIGYTVTIATVAIGFLGAMASILLTLRGSVMVFMKRLGRFSQVISFIWWAVRATAVLLGASLIFYFAHARLTVNVGLEFPKIAGRKIPT